jgi:hypothetical protein
MGVDAVLEAGRRFGWSEPVWWAWEDLNLRLHPETKIGRVPTGSAAREPSLAGQARFSSLVAAPDHGGLIRVLHPGLFLQDRTRDLRD